MSSTAKEPPKESPLKERKRRRPIKPEKTEQQTSPDTKKTRGPEADRAKQAKSAFYYEENQVEKRDPKMDLSLHKAASDELRKVMEEVVQLKSSNADNKEEKLEELRIHGTLQFVTLRKLNRMAHFRCKKARDGTNDAKQQIDAQNLRLQNLLYEVMHLQKEITKCLGFKSKDEDISLVPVDDFYKDAPADIARKDKTETDVHQQTLARLEWELEQRKRLSQQLKEAETHKEVFSTEIKAKKENLDSLQPKLNNILQGTKPVQQHLGMPFDETREQHETARYLPTPLYVLYNMGSAYGDACDKFAAVSIQGDVDEAKAVENTSVELDEDSDSDNEEQEKPREKRRRRTTTTTDDAAATRRQRVLRRHPLSVIVTVSCKDGSSLQLSFYYLVMLRIVTVDVKLSPSPSSTSTSISGSELLLPDSLLHCLYPGDTGDDTPNLANNFALQRLGLSDFSLYVRDVGRPYHWAQNLCGLQFIHSSPGVAPVPSGGRGGPQGAESRSYMEGTIQRLRQRVKARLSLQKQLGALERGSVAPSTEYHGLFPAKISARLTSWKRSVYEDFTALPYTSSLVTSGLAAESCLYFVGVAERGSAKMTLQAAVSHDYPQTAPLFAVNVHWKTDRNNTNDHNIREMEAEVNVHHDDLVMSRSADQLLTNQIQRLLMCLDVYLETDSGQSEGPQEFTRDKMCPRLTKGPGRTKPFKFNGQLGFFSQR